MNCQKTSPMTPVDIQSEADIKMTCMAFLKLSESDRRAVVNSLNNYWRTAKEPFLIRLTQELRRIK